MTAPDAGVSTVATVSGQYNTVVQVVGSNTTVQVAKLPVLYLNSVDHVSTSPMPSIFDLHPFSRRGSFVGRALELDELEMWLKDTAKISVRTLIGAPGVGKTRLAVELIGRAQNWTSGFLTRANLARFAGTSDLSLWRPATDTLVVVDYAASKTESLSAWMEVLGTRLQNEEQPLESKLRVLLLERDANSETGWFPDVFGGGYSWSDSRRYLIGAAKPIRLKPISSAKAAEAIILDAQRRWQAEDPSDCASILERLQQGDQIDVLSGNPLMLQIAAIEGSQASISRVALAEAAIKREKGRMLEDWKRKGVPEYLFGQLMKLVAVTNLIGDATAERLLTVIERFDTFALLRRSMEPARALDLLNPTLSTDKSFRVCPIEPDLLAEFFLATSDLDPATVADCCRFDPMAAGVRIGRTVDDFAQEKIILGRVNHWLRVAMELDLGSAALDMLRRGLGTSSSRQVQQVEVVLNRRVTEQLKSGGETVETYLMPSENDRGRIIAGSLLREAESLVATGQYEEAAQKITEALLQHPEEDIKTQMPRINLQIESHAGLNDKVRELAAIDEGIAACEKHIVAGNYFPEKNYLELARRAFDNLSPAENPFDTPRGLAAMVPTLQFWDLRLNQAELIRRRTHRDSCPADLVDQSVRRCIDVLKSDLNTFFVEEAAFYGTKYEELRIAGYLDHAKPFKRTQRTFQKAAQQVLSGALMAVAELQKFLIVRENGAVEAEVATMRIFDLFEYAVDHEVRITAKHLVQLVFCVMCARRINYEDPIANAAANRFGELMKGEDYQFESLLELLRKFVEMSNLSSCKRACDKICTLADLNR